MVHTTAIDTIGTDFVRRSKLRASKEEFRPKTVKESRAYFKKNYELFWYRYIHDARPELGTINYDELKKMTLESLSDEYFREYGRSEVTTKNRGFNMILRRIKKKVSSVLFN